MTKPGLEVKRAGSLDAIFGRRELRQRRLRSLIERPIVGSAGTTPTKNTCSFAPTRVLAAYRSIIVRITESDQGHTECMSATYLRPRHLHRAGRAADPTDGIANTLNHACHVCCRISTPPAPAPFASALIASCFIAFGSLRIHDGSCIVTSVLLLREGGAERKLWTRDSPKPQRPAKLLLCRHLTDHE